MKRYAPWSLLLFFLIACGGSDCGGPLIIEGVNLDELFAPPTQAERDAVEADWATRDTSAQNVSEVVQQIIDVSGVSFEARVVSHTVGGVLHYGAILAPEGAAADSLPVLLNVFDATPPDDTLDACVATAQIAVTADGVRVIINPDVMSPTGNPIVAEYGAPLGAPPAPCREAGSNPPDDGIGDGPG